MVVSPSLLRSSPASTACLHMTTFALHTLHGFLSPPFPPSPHRHPFASPHLPHLPSRASRHRWLFSNDRFDFSPLVFTELFSTEPAVAEHQRAAEQTDQGDSAAMTTPVKQFLPTWSVVQMAMAMSHTDIAPHKRGRHLVFLDVETTIPFRTGQRHQLLEFAAVAFDCSRGLAEAHSYNTLIRPKDPSFVTSRTTECNGITREMIADAPAFADVAHRIYDILHGHIWAGHNISRFDNLRIQEAFTEIGHPPPEPSGVIDTYLLLKKTFGKRAENYKLQTLANYCGYGKQEHRSLADVRMNVDVLRSCATLLFLESNFPDIFLVQNEIASQSNQSTGKVDAASTAGEEAYSIDVLETSIEDGQVSTVNMFTDNRTVVNDGKCSILETIQEDVERLTLYEQPQAEQMCNRSIVSSEQYPMLWSDPSSQTTPFHLARDVDLACLKSSLEYSASGCRRVLSYKGYPLQLLEFKSRVRFTVNSSYAFDENGRPKFSVLMEPSNETVDVICKCEELVKAMILSENNEIEWLPVLRNDAGVWTARMSVGTKGIGSCATYTTKFYQSTAKGLDEISLDPVNIWTFRNALPHGSIIDVGFGFYTFNVNNRAGVRLLAKHVTLDLKC